MKRKSNTENTSKKFKKSDDVSSEYVENDSESNNNDSDSESESNQNSYDESNKDVYNSDDDSDYIPPKDQKDTDNDFLAFLSKVLNKEHDSSWKKDIPKKKVHALEKKLNSFRDEIRRNTPTMDKILESNLPREQKIKAIEYFDMMCLEVKGNDNYVTLRDRINEMLITDSKDIISKSDSKIKKIRDRMNDEIISAKRIANALITESDKMIALQLFDLSQQCYTYSPKWYEVRNRIKTILNTEFKSKDELKIAEDKEAKIKTYTNTTNNIKQKIIALDSSETVKKELFNLYFDMLNCPADEGRYAEIKNRLNWALKLPYNKLSNRIKFESTDQLKEACQHIYTYLNNNIYGMNHVKLRIIQAVNNKFYNTNSNMILALKGNPGVGKTRIAKVIANAIGRPFERINLGGATDTTIFKGSDNVWLGASPSTLLQTIARSGASDSVILLDEIDKLGISQKGKELQSALLHILDPIQNKEFQDSYLNIFSHDISRIWFIVAMNDETMLTPEIRDRLDIVEISTYSEKDMINIVKKFTLPETLAKSGIDTDDITITDEAISNIICKLGTKVTNSGMRPIEKVINDIVSKISLLRICNDSKSIKIPYKLDDFKGFPYIITEYSIDVLCSELGKKKSLSLSYYS